MNLTPAQRERTTGDTTAAPDRKLYGLRLTLAWAGLALVVVLHLGIFFVGLPDYFVLLHKVCVGITCTLSEAPGPNDVHALRAIGLSVDFYAAYYAVLQVIVTVVGAAIGLFIFFNKPRDPMALFVVLLVVFLSSNLDPQLALVQFHPAWRIPQAFYQFVSSLAFLFFFLLFPDGRFVPRWTRFLAVALVVYSGVRNFVAPSALFDLVDTTAWFGSVGLGICAQVYRYFWVSTRLQRQQTKWLVYGCVVVVLVFFASLIPQPAQHGSLMGLLLGAAQTLSILLIPLSIGIATVYYRLWDIDLIIRRTLVYGILTACVIGLYVLVVGYLGTLFHTGSNLVISLLATGLVAVFFQPLKALLQRGVNRLLYGQRDEPYMVITRLGQRLKTTLEPEAVLSTIVATVREALKLSYAAIEVPEGAALVLAASCGTSAAKAVLRLPLTYQSQPVGTLIIAPRGRDDALTPADLRLLNDLTQQIGNAVHTVRLTDDLQALTRDLQGSREHLVTAREEERRRLRRDLHDGLGPMLSAIMLKVGLVRTLYQHDPATTDALLNQLESEIELVLADIRRLVYNLRPPALDELGLSGAIHEYVTRLAGEAQGLNVTVETPTSLLTLPAAVEVAAYRIVQEAVTNVIRHAHAHTCQVRLLADTTLQIRVQDNGTGISETHPTGIGLTSMRERAEELGGSFTIQKVRPCGTEITAHLPLMESSAATSARV